MSENHDIVDAYCSNHVINACYMVGYVYMLKSMQVIVLKVIFGWNCEFCEFWKIDDYFMNLKIESVFWNVLNVVLNYVNIGWSL